jgi:TolB-like protein/Flp pilus assembly protein TadD
VLNKDTIGISENRGRASVCYSRRMGLLHELRRRSVYGTVAIYLLTAWIAIQVASLAFPGLDIPDRAIRYVWLAAIVLFPIAVLFAWRFQITSRGIARTQSSSTDGALSDLPLARPDYLILVGLGLVVLVIVLRTTQEIVQINEATPVSVFGRAIHANSVAVLPFDNLTGEQNQEYLVDGIQESMTATLSQISGLRVKSRTSTASYRNTTKNITEIASELGVANVVEGAVFRTGEELRITVQLVDAVTDEYIWTESYERKVKDLLAMQSDVAREVAEQVSVELTPDEARRLRSGREVNPEVYEMYLKGMYFIKQLYPEAFTTGLEYLHDAVALDPREPLAYAGLALGYNTIGHGVNAHGAFPKALAAADKALQLDELSGEAWAALAEAQLYYEWDWEAAEKNMLRALQLSPSLDHVYAHYAYLLFLLDRKDEGIETMERARDLSPVDSLWAGFAAWLYMTEGRWEDAIQTAEECRQFSRELDLCLYTLGQTHAAQGDFDKAIEIQEQIAVGDPFRDWALVISYAQAGRTDESLQLISRMSVNATPRHQLHIALAYAAMGDFEQSLSWLGAAYESRSDWLPWVVLPNSYGGSVEPLREEAGFKAIVDAMDIPASY